MSKTTISNDKKVLTIEREFAASQSALWSALTEATKLDTWFAPKGWKCTTKSHDFIENGKWIYTLKCVDEAQTDFFGMEMPGMLSYYDIQAMDSFSYKDVFLDENGDIDQSLPGSNTLLELIEQENNILLRMTTAYASAEALQEVIQMGAIDGISESFDKLASELE